MRSHQISWNSDELLKSYNTKYAKGECFSAPRQIKVKLFDISYCPQRFSHSMLSLFPAPYPKEILILVAAIMKSSAPNIVSGFNFPISKLTLLILCGIFPFPSWHPWFMLVSFPSLIQQLFFLLVVVIHSSFPSIRFKSDFY